MNDERHDGEPPCRPAAGVPDTPTPAADAGDARHERAEAIARAEYLQQLVDQIPAFLWVIDRDLVVRRIEGGRPMLAALDRDRLIGLPMQEVTRMGASEEDVRLSVDMHRRALDGETTQYRATWKDLVLEARIRPLRDAGGAVVGVVGVGVDVSEQVRMQEQLRQAQKLEALGRLAGGVAHDFNNILAAIAGYAQLLHDDVPAGDARRDDLAEILKAAERATEITRQLLAFSRQQAPAAARIDLVELVHEISRMLRALLPATITLHLAPAPDAPPVEVLAERGRLEQVLLNLAVNARDAMPTGGALTIAVRAGTSTTHGETAVLEVRDTGGGMSPEVRRRVFEPFFTTKEPGRGTGLGLATVYGIVHQHDGAIEITSAPGEGTTVTVTLPRAAPGEAASVDAPAPVAPAHGGRVLVVEDEAQVRDVTTRMLERAGYEVLAAEDARAALRLLESSPAIDLVVTDSAMPGMRGEDLAAELARRRPGLPVIVASGLVDPAARRSDAVAAFIQKPFARDVLLDEVQRLLARQPPA